MFSSSYSHVRDLWNKHFIIFHKKPHKKKSDGRLLPRAGILRRWFRRTVVSIDLESTYAVKTANTRWFTSQVTTTDVNPYVVNSNRAKTNRLILSISNAWWWPRRSVVIRRRPLSPHLRICVNRPLLFESIVSLFVYTEKYTCTTWNHL